MPAHPFQVNHPLGNLEHGVTQPDGVLTRSPITGLIFAQSKNVRSVSGPPRFDRLAEAAPFSMSRLETAMNRLDVAMARLDSAVSRSVQSGDHDRETLEQELDALRQTHELLQEEARMVSDRLDLAVGRLQNVMAGSL